MKIRDCEEFDRLNDTDMLKQQLFPCPKVQANTGNQKCQQFLKGAEKEHQAKFQMSFNNKV